MDQLAPQKYRHIFWDWNGTLLNDMDIVIDAMNKLLERRNLPLLTMSVYKNIFTFPVMDYYALLGFDFHTESFEKLAVEFITELGTLKYGYRLQDGVLDVLSQVKFMGIGQSVLSASHEYELVEVLEDMKIISYFDRVAGLKDHYAVSKVQRGRELLTELKLKPESVLLIGDTLHDYEVAKEIGCDCLMIGNGHQSYQRLSVCGARIIHSIGDVIDFIGPTTARIQNTGVSIQNKGLHNEIRGKNVGCLIIHGFGGDVSEVQPLADFLIQKGYRVESPALKGHTGKRRDMKGCTYKDWIASAQKSYDELQAVCDTFVLVGFSMGGLIAFQIAFQNEVAAVVTLNTPIYYWDVKRVFINICEDLKTRKYSHISRYMDSVIKLPITAMLDFRRLLSETKPRLPEIQCPVFIAQGLKDDTTRAASATYLYEHVSSSFKKIEFYKESDHVILWGNEAENVIREVSDFLSMSVD